MAVRQVRLWSGLALFAIVSTLGALFYLWGSAVFWGDRLEAGEEVPEGVLRLLTGNFRLDEEQLIVFVDCDCPTCSELMEQLRQRSTGCAGEEVGWSLALVSRRPCEALTVLGSPFRVVIDSDGRVFRAFEIWQVPTVFVMDHRGMIVESAMGWEADAVVWKHMNQGGRE